MDVSALVPSGVLAENTIVIVLGTRYDQEVKVYAFKQTRVLVGRMSECDLVIQSDMVSRRHLLVTRTEDRKIVVEDAGSCSGIYINGYRLGGRTVVSPDDKIMVGQCFIQCLSGEI
jgi:pSer/pThr/pTyr-binding forkhead associated (FHA) protein